MSQDKITLTVADLTINGLSHHGVASFRNLKYAQVAGRWYEARLLDLASQKGVWDATEWGLRAPQTIDVGNAATSHLYPRMSTHDATCEFECLNLNVYAPAAALQAASNDDGLPVIVWMHGGSFEWGDGGSQYDGQHLVSHSIHTNQPVIVVGINYRLGMLGFFTSEELRQEARERGEAGYSNLGFHDQRLALQWVRENIHLFGGDASRITLAGESAGAISVLAHLRGKVPVAASALLMSPATISPKSFALTQVTFDKACEALGFTDPEASAADKIAALRQLPCEKLHELGANRLETMLCEDPVFFEDWSGQRFEELSALPSWIRRIVVGQLSEELTVMAHVWKSLPSDELLNTWKQLYADPAYAHQVLTTYNVAVEQENMPENVVHGLADYVSDALFDKAVRSIAETHLHTQHDEQPRVYVYRFEQPDLVAPGQPHHGHAYHSLDNAFFFHFPSVTGEHAPREMRTTADDFCGMALRLAHGNELWEAHKMAVFSGEGLRVLDLETPRWATLVDTAEKMDQFLLGKELLWKVAVKSQAE